MRPAVLACIGLLAAPPSPVDFARVGIEAAAIVGTRKLGAGTRDGYRGTMAALDLDVVRFPWERVGFDGGFVVAKVAVPYRTHDADYGRLWGGLDVALVRGAAGSAIIGVGPGLEFGPRMWWVDGPRGFVDAGFRLRWFPGSDFAVHANLRADVVATGSPPATTTRAELLVGRSLVFVGVRWVRTGIEAGQPARVYVDHVLGLSVSIGVHG